MQRPVLNLWSRNARNLNCLHVRVDMARMTPTPKPLAIPVNKLLLVHGISPMRPKSSNFTLFLCKKRTEFTELVRVLQAVYLECFLQVCPVVPSSLDLSYVLRPPRRVGVWCSWRFHEWVQVQWEVWIMMSMLFLTTNIVCKKFTMFYNRLIYVVLRQANTSSSQVS